MFAKLNIKIVKHNVKIFCTPVKWAVKIFNSNIMFFLYCIMFSASLLLFNFFIWRVAKTYFPRYHKMIWNFYTYIPDGAEKAAQGADFPGRPAYDVLKISSPDAEKIGLGRPRRTILNYSFFVVPYLFWKGVYKNGTARGAKLQLFNQRCPQSVPYGAVFIVDQMVKKTFDHEL